MRDICNGTENTDVNDIGAAFVKLDIDTTNDTFAVTADSRVSISVQLGTPGKVLQGGETIALYAEVVKLSGTGDTCPLKQEMISVPSGVTYLYHTLKPFDVDVTDTIAVYAKSSDVLDVDVGYQVSVKNHDVLPTDSVDAVALSADAVTLIWAKTMSDMAAVPGFNASALDALNLIFMSLRNVTTTTGSALSIKKDDGLTEMAGAVLSDDTVTFTKNELT